MVRVLGYAREGERRRALWSSTMRNVNAPLGSAESQSKLSQPSLAGTLSPIPVRKITKRTIQSTAATAVMAERLGLITAASAAAANEYE